MIAKKRAFEKWVESSNIKFSFQVAARHVLQLEILLQEKEELEKKVEAQTDQNEQLELLLNTQLDQKTECPACCRRKLQTLQYLHDGLDPDSRLETEGAVSDTGDYDHIRQRFGQRDSSASADISDLLHQDLSGILAKRLKPNGESPAVDAEDDFAVTLQTHKRGLIKRQNDSSGMSGGEGRRSITRTTKDRLAARKNK